MDRNLGATSATPGDVGALGLLYQWGRKNPFLGMASISSNVAAVSTGTWSTSSEYITCDKAEANPMTFYTSTVIFMPDDSWQSEKTVYDPCPNGWRVPDGGEDGVWSKAAWTNFIYDNTNKGLLFDLDTMHSSAWYPFSGQRDTNGTYNNIHNGHYWSCTYRTSNFGACFLYFQSSYYAANQEASRYCGKSVRCYKID